MTSGLRDRIVSGLRRCVLLSFEQLILVNFKQICKKQLFINEDQFAINDKRVISLDSFEIFKTTHKLHRLRYLKSEI